LNPRNPTSLKLQIDTAGGRFGATNEGFKGVLRRTTNQLKR